MRNLVFFLSLLLIGLSACKSSTSGETTVAEESGSNFTTPDPNTLRRAAEGRLGDSTMFPYVYQGEGRTNLFEAYTMKFQLAYDPLLYPMTNNETPWLKPEVYSEQTGVFITYVRNGRDLILQNPYMQVQYIRRDLPYCSSVDSVYLWLDDIHLKQRNGSMRTEPFTRPTQSGKTAAFKEYTIPDQQDKAIAGKQISYAYVPYDDTYFIGFALTCTSENDFEENKTLFYQLVESFQYY